MGNICTNKRIGTQTKRTIIKIPECEYHSHLKWGNHHTQLTSAMMDVHLICVNQLIELGGDVNETNADEQAALHFHYSYVFHFKDNLNAMKQHVRCVNALIQTGADVNLPNRYARTPLYTAALNGHVECLNLLIEAGADVSTCDREGYPVLVNGSFEGRISMSEFVYSNRS